MKRRDEEQRREDVAQAERVTTEAARRFAGADQPGAIEPSAPSLTDETGTTYLGVDEPRVERTGVTGAEVAERDG